MPFAQAVLRGYFQQGCNIADIDVIADLVCGQTGKLGNAEAVCTQLKSNAAKMMLQDAISAAAERKVFGSPFVVVDAEPFFGVDRLPQIAAKLAASAA